MISISITISTIGWVITPTMRLQRLAMGARLGGPVRARRCGLRAGRHRGRGAADRVRAVEIANGISERLRIDRSIAAEAAPGRRRHRIDVGEKWSDQGEAPPQLSNGVVGQFSP